MNYSFFEFVRTNHFTLFSSTFFNTRHKVERKMIKGNSILSDDSSAETLQGKEVVGVAKIILVRVGGEISFGEIQLIAFHVLQRSFASVVRLIEMGPAIQQKMDSSFI